MVGEEYFKTREEEEGGMGEDIDSERDGTEDDNILEGSVLVGEGDVREITSVGNETKALVCVDGSEETAPLCEEITGLTRDRVTSLVCVEGKEETVTLWLDRVGVRRVEV